MRSLALIAVAAVVTGACGSTDSPASPATEPTTSLTVTFRSGPGAAPSTTTLRCAPARGTVPRPGRACQRLAALPNAFAPTPKDVACTQIYGGPQTATVSGTFRGKPIRTTFTRRDGCEIDRWNRHGFLLPTGASLGPA